MDRYICLSCKQISQKVPTASEKEILFKAGLGYKRIQFNVKDGEEEVIKILCSEESGYPQLKNMGGFQMLRCNQNCRKLSVLECPWTITDLQSTLSGQCKIYLRPIQQSLDTIPIVHNIDNTITESCKGCGGKFKLNDLRKHVAQCLESDTDDVPELMSGDFSTLPSSHPVAVEISSDVDRSATESFPSIIIQEANELSVSSSSSTVNNSELYDIVLRPSGLSIQETVIAQLDDPQTDIDPFQHNFTNVTFDTRIIADIVRYCKDLKINDPVDILRIVQTNIVTGRDLELKEISNTIAGVTNLIMVDRENLIETSFDEIQDLPVLRPCLEVQFYGEANSSRFGGPRKEFFTLILKEIQMQFLNPVKELSDRYEVIGKIMGGRRGSVTLNSILRFTTGTEEEPVLGFVIHPSISFVKAASFIPTANTCVNKLNLTIPSGDLGTPHTEVLFQYYDYAFLNSYFGLD